MRNVRLAVIGLAAFGLLSGAPQAVAQDSPHWEIGPNIRGRNYSVGMPPAPTPLRRGGWSFDFPYPRREAGHVHYVTHNPGPLIGASRIVVRYRIDAERGARFVPQEEPLEPAATSIFIQRRGDNWSAKRQYEYFRWYAPSHTVRRLAPGEYEMVVSISDPNWISVHGTTSAQNPAAFRATLEDTSSIGIVFGSAGLRGHGVFSTGRAKYTLLEFRIS